SDITKLKILNNDVFNIEIEYDNKKYTIGLNGKYQIYNTLTVLKVVEVLNKLKFITKYQDVYYGIKNTSIAGRFEILSNKPLIIADGAHNKSGIKVFIQSIIEIKCDNKIAIVSILKDKDITSMDKLFCNNFDKIIIVPINTLRGSDIKYIENDIKQYNKNVECIFDYKEAINLAKKYANNTGMICIFGSLYLISDIRKIIL
ncbi:MAG: cyanophycin synthetase, partial [Clostridia bacterium]